MSKGTSRKPRFITVEAKFGDGPYPDSVTFNKGADNVAFKNSGEKLDPEKASIDWGYSRPKKEKRFVDTLLMSPISNCTQIIV